MPEKIARPARPSGIEKRGGYSGGKPAASVKPPVKVPSGAIKPSNNGNANKKA